MGKVLKLIGTIVLIGAAVLTGVAGIAFGLAGVLGVTVGGISLGTLFIGGAVLSFAGTLLQGRPSVPSTSQSMADRLKVTIDTRAPRRIVFGRTALALDLRDQEFSADQHFLHRFVVHAAHLVGGIDEYWFDDKQAAPPTGGVTADYLGYLNITAVVEGSAANAVNIGPRMGSTRRYTGCAYTYFRFKLTGNDKKHDSPFAQSVPSRMTVRGRGAYLYDPRLDSTVPGGSGTMRAGDQTTWTNYGWTDDRCRNPALQLLWYMLGWRIHNPVTGEWRLSVGKGIPPERIDLPSFIAAANLCDEPVTLATGGTEPRYRADGVFSEGDDPKQVVDNLKAAMNADLDDVNGKLRLFVFHNDLGTPIADFTADDIIGDFVWQQTLALNDRFNVIHGSYTDPSDTALYQQVDYPEVRIASRDGIDRIETLPLPMCESPSQAQRIAKQRLARNLYGGTFKAPFQITAWRARRLDVIRLTFPPLGWVNKLFRIAEREIGFDGRVPLLLREEHPDIYLWDADERPAVQGAAPTTYDQRQTPIALSLGDIETDVVAVQADADAALAGLSTLGDDGVLSTAEKITKLIPLNTELANAYSFLDGRAASLVGFAVVASARAAATAAWTAWTTYRDALSPAWNNTTLDTAVVRATYDGKIADLQYALDQLADAIRQSVAVNNVNRIPFSDFGQNTRGWNSVGGGSPTLVGIAAGTGFGVRVLIVDVSFPAAGGTRFYNVFTDPIPVVAGERLAIQMGGEAFTFAGSIGVALLRMVMSPHDASGASVGGDVVVASLSGPQSFNTPLRAFYTVPAGAVTVVPYLQMIPDANAGTVQMSLVHPMMSSATADQTEYPPYAPGREDGAAGAPGDPGADGVSPIVAALSATTIPVQADYTNVTKAGQLPKSSTLTVKRGDTDILSGCTVTLSPSSGITASFSAGVIQVTDATTAGYVDVSVVYGGSEVARPRLQVTRQQDAAPPQSQASASVENFFTVGSTATSYTGPLGDTIILKANGSGQLICNAGMSWTAFGTPLSGYRVFSASAAFAYRVAGSGSGWSYTSEQAGTVQASTPPSGSEDDPTPGALSISRTIGSLTAGVQYEIGIAVRKTAGGTNHSGNFDANVTVSQ